MTALICPRCGGSLKETSAQAVSVKCEYCGTVVRLDQRPPGRRATITGTTRPWTTRVALPAVVMTVAVAVTAYSLIQWKASPSGVNGVLSAVHQFGDEGVGAGEFTEVRGFSAGHGLIFTQERKGRVQAFDLEGQQVGSWILPGEFSHYGFAAGGDGSVYKVYGPQLRRFEGRTGAPLQQFDAKELGLTHWRFLAPGPAGTIFVADDANAIQLDPGQGRVLMQSSYLRPFKFSGGLTNFAANALGEVYLSDMAEHDIVRISPDGQLRGRFVTTKRKGLTPLATAMATLPASGRLGIATALGLELYDPDGRFLDMLQGSPLDFLAAPDEHHLAAWVSYGSRVKIYQIK